ncbi:hypothetical protein K7862_36905 [Streptomyces sp. PLK6-54]|uniref:Lipoprotein n=2 Tax=Actinacidiphila acidipaludis TaxID=2873382 RepID=A0ABS7QJ34_9ACTN|nr:hypothetical protein [Streptomyces acidipaludis]
MLLTACGGGGGDKSSDKITSTQPVPTATSASPSASATMTVNRPVITFPGDAKNVFEDQHTGDPKKDAVLADNEQMVDSIYSAIIQGNAHTSAMAFYSKGLALGSAATFVQGWVNGDASWTGTIRWFHRKVTIRNDNSAVVVYCSDESKAYPKSRKSGKIDRSASNTASYVLYNTRLEKSPDGVWQTVNLVSQRGAKACKP